MSGKGPAAEAAAGEDRNEVILVGRVSGRPTVKEMPSGDSLVTLRLVVGRAKGDPVDTIDLACWSASARRSAERLGDGDRAEVHGALRRRFFRTATGAASRYEVEVMRLRRVARAT